MTNGAVRARRALISVSDKAGLADLAGALAAHGIDIVSTGGTAAALRAAGAAVRGVAELTGLPEMLDGRVKTLHPAVHAGILARRERPEHLAALERHDIAAIDLVIVNLYPFEATVAGGADRESCIENIDIGGPAMIRAAAKNADSVAVLVDPADYAGLIAELTAHGGGTGLEFRRRLQAKAYAHTAAYDAAIAAWLAGNGTNSDAFAERLLVSGRLGAVLRYGENPHQTAAFYADPAAGAEFGIGAATQVQGKALSYNNYNDTDAALACVADFDPARPAAVIVKHANPCGVAVADTALAAYRRALACDPISAFGGIIALNRPLDGDTATAIADIFTEVVIAPGADDAARAAMAAKPNLRLLTVPALPDPARPSRIVKSIAGGWLVQDRDVARIERDAVQVVSRRPPTDRELADLLFAFRVAKHVKSNAIVYARDGATVGIGAGQMSRVDSARIAARKAEDAARAAGAAGAAGLPAPLTQGSVVASDAFFPFADGLLAAAEAGATAVIQPGGSMRDDQVIAAADEAGLAMVFTGVRHFRH